DAAVADRDRLLVRPASAMVQKILGRLLPRGGDHRAVFNLGAAAAKTCRGRLPDLFTDRDRGDGKLLLLQSHHDRALSVVVRCRIFSWSFVGRGQSLCLSA